MSFVPSNSPTPTPLDLILSALTTDCTDPKSLSQEELAVYRLQLAAVKTLVGTKMAETSTKEHNYADDAIVAYIDEILEDGFNLIETELSDYPEFVDAQRLKRWSKLIGERVEASVFGSKKFKIHSLRLLRSNIASAKTLHDLRKAVTMMISPLQLWRDHVALMDATSDKAVNAANAENDKYIDSLLLENEALRDVAVERKRVIDSMLTCYDEVDEEIALLQRCEGAKKEHNLSDAQLCDMFNISRSKLHKLRKDIDLDALPPKPTEIVVQPHDQLYYFNLMKHYENLEFDFMNNLINNIAKEQSNEAYSY